MYDSYRVLSRAVGVMKPQEAQKTKALWAMKAAKDGSRRGHFENAIGVVGRTSQGSNCCAGQRSKAR